MKVQAAEPKPWMHVHSGWPGSFHLAYRQPSASQLSRDLRVGPEIELASSPWVPMERDSAISKAKASTSDRSALCRSA